MGNLYDDIIEIPETYKLLSTFTSLVSIHLFDLYIAEKLGRNVDKPKNLAKVLLLNKIAKIEKNL